MKIKMFFILMGSLFFILPSNFTLGQGMNKVNQQMQPLDMDLVNVSNAPDIIDTLPAIAVDKNNHVHIAWNGFYNRPEAPDGVASDIFYTNNKGGSFTAPMQIGVPIGWYSKDPTIAVDLAGNVHIAFRRSYDQMVILGGDDIYYVTNEGGSFDNLVLLVDGKDDYPHEPYVMAPHFPRIHYDNQDNIHLLFMAYKLKVSAGENPYQSPIVHMNNINGVWSDPRPAVAKRSSDFNSCLDRQGHVHIVIKVHESIDYIGYDFIYYTNNTAGEFLTPILATSAEHSAASEPDVAVDSLGYAHIVYRYDPTTATYYTPSLFYVNNVSGSFSSWIAICEDKYYYLPSIAIDDSDFVHITYKRWMYMSPRGGQLFYGNNINGDFYFISLSDARRYRWYPGSRYFVLGESSTLHFAFHDWIGSDTDIFYLNDKWSDEPNIDILPDTLCFGMPVNLNSSINTDSYSVFDNYKLLELPDNEPHHLIEGKKLVGQSLPLSQEQPNSLNSQCITGGNIDTLMYDDGIPETFYSSGSGGLRMASRMSPVESCKILAIQNYCYDTQSYKVGLYDWNGSNPENQILETAVVSSSGKGWNTTDISSYNIYVRGDFIASFNMIETVAFLGFDTYNNGRFWDYDGAFWNTGDGTYFIRAIVVYEYGVVDTVGTMTIKNLGNTDLIVNDITTSQEWITSIEPHSFTVVPDGSEAVFVTVSTAGLSNGTYYGSLNIFSNDPDENPYIEPVNFTFYVYSPVVRDIPDQTIDEGGSFAAINLDNFVTDPDNEDSEISWSFSGNDELSIEVDGSRVATISTPDENWFGSETITFTAKDPGNASSSNDVMFTVNSVNDPPVISGLPEFVEFVSDTIFTIDIWELISDVETLDDLLICEFSVDSDSLFFSYDDGTGMLTLSAELKFGGEGNLILSVSDSEEIVEDTVRVVVEKAVIISIDKEVIIPKEFALHQNYPNPFNPSTTIKYSIPNVEMTRRVIFTKLIVYDVLGKKVATLVNQEQKPGYYEVEFNAANISSGVYYYQLRASSFIETKKMILMR